MRHLLINSAAAIGVGIIVLLAVLKVYAPYGHREAFMRGVDSCLQNYATENGGWFPNGANPWDALSRLYPNYCSRELAGLTGDVQSVTNALATGKSISNLTSWVYVPGFREDDNGEIAILWESRNGVSANGKISFQNKRPVLLINRDIIYVAADEWDAFLKNQRQLRTNSTHQPKQE